MGRAHFTPFTFSPINCNSFQFPFICITNNPSRWTGLLLYSTHNLCHHWTPQQSLITRHAAKSLYGWTRTQGRDTMWLGEWFLPFQRAVVPSSSGLEWLGLLHEGTRIPRNISQHSPNGTVSQPRLTPLWSPHRRLVTAAGHWQGRPAFPVASSPDVCTELLLLYSRDCREFCDVMQAFSQQHCAAYS